jgi:NADPH:quinone reductase-like Zn-dependent oxidoreductase
LEALASATKTLGYLIVYGALGAAEPTPLPLLQLFTRTVKLYAGYKVFDFTGNPNMGIPRDEAATARATEFITAGLRSGDFRPKIDRVFHGLDQYADAHRYMELNSQSRQNRHPARHRRKLALEEAAPKVLAWPPSREQDRTMRFPL